MRNTKKILGIVLALIVLTLAMSISIFAQDSESVVLPDGVTVADFGDNTVTDGTNFYATIKSALEGIHLTDNRILYCKPGADVGVMTHGHVCANLTVYGNGAALTASGEQDFELDSYKFCHNGANTCDGVTGELTLTVKNLNGCGAWGQRTTSNTVNIVFENCKDMNRVYVNGTSGINNITLTNCSFLGTVENRCTLYSNANGTVTVSGCEFENIYAPINLNHKVAGTQTIVIENTSFDTCGTAEYDYAAPVRVLSSVEGAESTLTVSGCSFANTVANKNGQNADILLDYGVGTTNASVSSTTANVTVEVENNVSTDTTVSAEATGSFTNVAVAYVAEVDGQKFATVLEALTYAIDNSKAEVKILDSVRELMPTDVELILNADLAITADAPVEVKFYNDGTSYDFVINSNNNNTLTIGENVSFILEDRNIWLGYYGNNVDVVVNGTLKAGYQLWVGADLTVNSTGTVISADEALVIRRGATLTVDGGDLVANYFSILSGNIDAKNGAEITSGPLWISNNGGYASESNVNISIVDSTLTSTGNIKSSSTHADGVNITINNSTVSFSNNSGYGAGTLDENTTVSIENGANVTLSNTTNNGEILVEAGVTLNSSSELTNVVPSEENKEVIFVDGKYEVVDATYVAIINGVKYKTFAEALTAASAMNGDVVVEIYDKVTLNSSLAGSYDSITFVGKSENAEIYLEVQGYITATGKEVAFEDLKLSKSEGGFITNAGFMNVAFGVYDVVSVDYTNCTFVNGAYASSGDVTFTGCTFYRSHDKYGL
ncbi:MAG: hypothetical protein IKA02_02060, partial [Clostridia bacterium]|nr:hypothetical protein [Clostridia bacterium]